MRFSVISKICLSGLMVGCLALPLVGCSPEASTTTTRPASTGTGARPKEQTGTSMGDTSIDKGREVPEPNPADQDAAPAEEKAESEKPTE